MKSWYSRANCAGVILPLFSHPDGLLSLDVTDNIFVLWASAAVHAGFSAQRAAGRDLRFTVLEGAFVQFGFEEIPVQAFEISVS